MSLDLLDCFLNNSIFYESEKVISRSVIHNDVINALGQCSLDVMSFHFYKICHLHPVFSNFGNHEVDRKLASLRQINSTMSSAVAVFVFLSLCSVHLMQCTPGIYQASEGCGPPKLDASYLGGKNLGMK